MEWLDLKTLDDMSKKIKVTNSQQRVLQFKQQGNVAFSPFLKSQSLGLKLDLEELMSYPLTPVPHSNGNVQNWQIEIHAPFTERCRKCSLSSEEGHANHPWWECLLLLSAGSTTYFWPDQLKAVRHDASWLWFCFQHRHLFPVFCEVNWT